VRAVIRCARAAPVAGGYLCWLAARAWFIWRARLNRVMLWSPRGSGREPVKFAAEPAGPRAAG